MLDATTKGGQPLGRRRFLRRLLWAGIGLTGSGGILSALNERSNLSIHRVTVPLPGLPDALDGLTLCQLSDLHRGYFVSEAHVCRAVALALAARPDLIVLTGDFISHAGDFATSCVAALSPLRAPYGVYAVLGNHDYWNGAQERLAEAFPRAGIRLLRNESVPIRVRGTEWWLCGTDDARAERYDLDATLRGVPDGCFRVLLCHEPDLADEAAKRGIPLQLSGHSHGGQVALPWLGPLILPRLGRRYPRGLEQVPGTETQVFTSLGVGVVGPPIRLGCPPEVALLRLVRA